MERDLMGRSYQNEREINAAANLVTLKASNIICAQTISLGVMLDPLAHKADRYVGPKEAFRINNS